MSISIYPIGFGCCQNVHLMCRIGNKTNPFIKLRIVGFHNIGEAYITEVIGFKPSEYDLINVQEILKRVDDQLFISYDFKLKVDCLPEKKYNVLEIISIHNLGIKSNPKTKNKCKKINTSTW